MLGLEGVSVSLFLMHFPQPSQLLENNYKSEILLSFIKDYTIIPLVSLCYTYISIHLLIEDLRNQILHEFLVILKPLTGVYKEKSSACS